MELKSDAHFRQSITFSFFVVYYFFVILFIYSFCEIFADVPTLKFNISSTAQSC